MEETEGITFVISGSELKKLNTWLEEHDKVCPCARLRHQSLVETLSGPAILESGLSYVFIPNSVGVVKIVKCKCGGDCDITDYESW